MFATYNVGERIGTSNCKVNTDTGSAQRETRTLHIINCTDMAHTSANEINARNRNLVNVRGIKICAEVNNQLNEPLYLNMALLSVKNGNVVSNVDFFRSPDASQTRSRNFANTLTSMDFHCLPLNSDQFTILKHKRYRLNGKETNNDYVANNGNTFMNIDWYKPIKRQIRFDENAQTLAETPIYLVYWCDRFGALTGTVSQANAMRFTWRVLTYFKEPKNS